MTVFLGNFWSSTKQIKASYNFDWEHGIALHAIRPVGLQLVARGKSHGFSRVAAGTWGIFSSGGGVNTSKPVFVQRRKDYCLDARDTLVFSSRLGRAIGVPFKVRQETQGPFPVATGILGFLSIFKRQGSTPFEALNSACLSK